MFDPPYLLQHLGDYYADKRLAEMREIIQWEVENHKAIAVASVKRLPLGTMVATFSSDGLKATVLDYNAAGRVQSFDLKTRKPIAGDKYPDTMHMVEMAYDASARRWKIAHAMMNYDLDARQIIWREEMDDAR